MQKVSLPILESDNLVVKRIKNKLNQSGGNAMISLFKGEPCEIRYSENGNGLESSKIPLENQLTWDVFNAVVKLVINSGGRAHKGNARAGKLGSNSLPLDSVEGYITHKIHWIKEGESAYGPGFVVCAILDWADICKNERGYLSINPNFLESSKRLIDEFLKGGGLKMLELKKRIAKIAGYFQITLAIIGFIEVLRRFFVAEKLPDFATMI